MYIKVEVELEDGYTGNWRESIMESWFLAKRVGCDIKLVYANQVAFFITQEMSLQDVEKMTRQKISVGV